MMSVLIIGLAEIEAYKAEQSTPTMQNKVAVKIKRHIFAPASRTK
jgi:hypothetical protein